MSPALVSTVTTSPNSPSMKMRSPVSVFSISKSSPGPLISHTGQAGASPDTSNWYAPATVDEARTTGKNGILADPSNEVMNGLRPASTFCTKPFSFPYHHGSGHKNDRTRVCPSDASSPAPYEPSSPSFK